MNVAVLTQLKILVERAVRPVRAGTSRKRKMREEMLAHVAAVFEEEQAKVSDELAALAQVELRFGTPAELTAQLQQAVPRHDWLVRFAEGKLPRPGESTLYYALRLAFWYVVLITPFILVISLHMPWGAVFAAGEIVFSFSCFFTAVFLARAMWLALYGPTGRSMQRIILVTAAASFVGVNAQFLYCVVRWYEDRPNSSIEKIWSEALPVLPGMTLGGPFLLIFASYVIWQGLYGPAQRSWWLALLGNLALCLAAACVTFGLGAALSGDLSSSVGSMFPSILAAEWLIPIDLLLRVAGGYRRIRSDREWANLPINGPTGVAA